MKYSKLLQAVRDVLFNEWDLIGVNDNSLCRNEYDSYAPTICRLIREGADPRKIANHLEQLQTSSMGLSRIDSERDIRVARRLISLVKPDRNL